MYYLFRIFVPILLIISVSYVTFFLKDFTKRIEVATGNLLLFIAFSWSLAEDYPRMGYLTFVDVIMAITFVINTLVVIYNVYLKWLENNDRQRTGRTHRPGGRLDLPVGVCDFIRIDDLLLLIVGQRDGKPWLIQLECAAKRLALICIQFKPFWRLTHQAPDR